MLSHVRLIHDPARPPLLLVHPYGTSHHAFAGVSERLAADFEVVAVDLPGFGDSAPVTGTPTLRALTDACADLMADLGHERFHVAGNSTGGGVALHLALEGRALSACALSPIGFTEGWERYYLQLSIWNAGAAGPLTVALMKTIGRSAPVRRALVRQFNEHGERLTAEFYVEAFERLRAASDYWGPSRHALIWRCPEVSDLPCPVTVAWAEFDRLLLTKPQSARARERLPTARHVTLPDCGHLAMFDDPALVAETIRAAAA